MAKTRKVKDAIDLNTNELVYFAGHAKATYMSDGTTVEDAINNIKIGAEVDLSNYATKEELSSKQDKLVSGTNIKTINGESLLGSGNITISGGSGSSSSGNGAYVEVNHGTSDATFTLTPNTFHVWDEVNALTLDLGSETSGVANEYLFQFTSGITPTVLILPDSIVWANDEAPIIESNYIYQISILKRFATLMKFKKPVNLITFTIKDATYQAEEGMTWGQWVNSDYNTRPFYIHTGKNNIYLSPLVDNGMAYAAVLLNSTAVTLTDVIIENNIYSTGLPPGRPRSL